MKRCALLCCLGLALGVAAPAPAGSAQTAPPVTIVMVLPNAAQTTEAGFRASLERAKVTARYVEVRFSGLPSDAQALRAQVASLQPDLVYVRGTPASLALAGRHDENHAAHALRDTPIVFTDVTDPVDAGLIRNPQQPERNITGVSHVAPLAIQFNTLQAYRPFRKIGYLHNPAEPNSLSVLRALQALARREGLEVIAASLAPGPDPAQIAPLIADIAARGADLLYIGPVTFLAFTHRDAVMQAALRQRLPTFCTTESIVRHSGCLFGLFANDSNVGRFAGAMARQILVEKKPVSAIPAATLQRFSLLLNIPTAQALGLYPPMLLLSVAEVLAAAPPARR